MPPRSESISDSLSKDPKERVNLLLRHEQELLARVLQHTEMLSTTQAELLPLMQRAIARAVGELIMQRSAEGVGIEIVEILKKQGPHPPKAEPLPESGPHPPKPPSPPGPGQVEPLTGPHPPKPPGPGQVEPLTGPHPPRPPGPGQAAPSKAPVPAKAPGSKPIAPPASPHPPKPPGPGAAKPMKVPAPPKPPAGPHPPKPPGPGATRKMSSGVESATMVRANPAELRAVCATAEEFLMPSELQELMRYTLARERDFEISEVVSPGVTGRGTVDDEYRRSRVLMRLAEHEERLLKRLRGMLPLVCRKLGMEPFEPGRAEVQITASNHGDFFRDHSDNGHAEIASRALTFVYFFHREPKPFQGGELRLYDSRFAGDYWVRLGAGRVIVPEQNQMVFFPSELVHEITPVVCPSQSFEHSRFTVNGWLHRR
jgi:2OG-Fe(II) oxygenase superfamily